MHLCITLAVVRDKLDFDVRAAGGQLGDANASAGGLGFRHDLLPYLHVSMHITRNTSRQTDSESGLTSLNVLKSRERCDR